MRGLHRPIVEANMRFKHMLERRAGTPRDPVETRERLLDAAERLFAEDGIGRTSLRAITLAAGVNVAAIHYHFGSKEALLDAVLTRRIAPVNRERLALLDAIEHESAGAILPLVPVVEAFLAPLIQLAGDPASQRLALLFGRLEAEPVELVASVMREQFGDVARRFRAALGRALPHLSQAEVAWRLHCAIGAVGHMLLTWRHAEIGREFGLDEADEATTRRRLVAFCATGFRAPPAAESGS